jgi:hypothetical protein
MLLQLALRGEPIVIQRVPLRRQIFSSNLYSHLFSNFISALTMLIWPQSLVARRVREILYASLILMLLEIELKPLAPNLSAAASEGINDVQHHLVIKILNYCIWDSI